MPILYITYRDFDTSRDEVQGLVTALSPTYGKSNISVSKTEKNVDIFTLQKHVQMHNCLLLLIGRRFTSLVDEDGISPIHSAYDYLHAEILLALEDKSIQIFIVLTDGASLPDVSFFPEAIRGVLQSDVIELYNPRTKRNDVGKLRRKLINLYKPIPQEVVDVPQKVESDAVADVTEGWSAGMKALDSCFWTILIGVAMLVASLCYLLLQYRTF